MKKTLIAAAACAAITSTAMANALDPNNPSGTVVDRFADIEVLRYTVPGFENLSLDQKKFVYYLTEAALAGRDILWDQNGKYNLDLRMLLEGIYKNYMGDPKDPHFAAFEKYLKQVEFGNGAYHHYSTDKFIPEFPEKWFDAQVDALAAADPQLIGKIGKEKLEQLRRLIFDASYLAKRVNQAEGEDIIATSANNMYEGVTQQEVEDYFAALKKADDPTPISYGLNTKVAKIDGKVVEIPYKIGGLYSPAIERIVENLEKALPYAETEKQVASTKALIDFYRTGDLKAFDTYSILWTEDTAPVVDFINGFIVSYGDPGSRLSISRIRRLRRAPRRFRATHSGLKTIRRLMPVSANLR